MHSSNIKYIPQVDHLRAVAAIWIVLYHGEQLIEAFLRTGKDFAGEWHYTMNPLIALVREGHSAVALFMVLSGFIFSYGTYGKSISYRGFMLNRLLRIYPLFLCVAFLSLAVNPSAFNLSAFVTTVLPLANVQMLPTGSLVSMSWAIAVEFQFYLIFPFLMRFLNGGTLKFVAAVISCALLFRLLGVGLGANARDLSYWHLAGRIDQFIAGMAAAAVLRKIEVRQSGMRALFVVSVILIVGTLYGFHRLGGWPVNATWKVLWPTVEGVMYALAVASYVGSGSLIPDVVSRAVAALGEVSFSMYLLHFPLIAVLVRNGLVWRPTGNTSVDAVLSTVGIALPLTVMVSMLTYHSIEKPFLSLRRRYIDPTRMQAA